MLKDMFLQGAQAALTEHDRHIRDVARAYVASLETGDVDARLALFAEDGVVEDPVGSVPHVGHAAIRAVWMTGSGMTMRPRFDKVVVCANEALICFSITLSAPGAGEVTISPIDHIVMDAGGKIAKLRAYFDPDSIT